MMGAIDDTAYENGFRNGYKEGYNKALSGFESMIHMARNPAPIILKTGTKFIDGIDFDLFSQSCKHQYEDEIGGCCSHLDSHDTGLCEEEKCPLLNA